MFTEVVGQFLDTQLLKAQRSEIDAQFIPRHEAVEMREPVTLAASESSIARPGSDRLPSI